jgi:hypothetical protein
MPLKAIIAYDLGDPGVTRACIATRNAVTVTPCQHGETWHCPYAKERYIFLTTSPAAAEAMGAAVPE